MRRTGIWPALSDLYAGLFVTCLVGLLLVPQRHDEPEPVIEKEARKISEDLKNRLPADLQRKSRVQTGDLYVDVILNFRRDDDELQTQQDRETVRYVAGSIEQALAAAGDPARMVDIWVEGHTDSSNPQGLDGRGRFIYNWNLSSRRAVSVLYEMARAGLDPKSASRRIHAIGYADTKPLVANPSTPADWLRNRRTTFRLHPNRCLIDAQISKYDESYCETGAAVPATPPAP